MSEKRELRTLEEHRAERWKAHEEAMEAMKPHPNGLACPECGEELWDSNPTIVLTSNPPQKNIHCPACGWRGYALL